MVSNPQLQPQFPIWTLSTAILFYWPGRGYCCRLLAQWHQGNFLQFFQVRWLGTILPKLEQCIKVSSWCSFNILTQICISWNKMFPFNHRCFKQISRYSYFFQHLHISQNLYNHLQICPSHSFYNKELIGLITPQICLTKPLAWGT